MGDAVTGEGPAQVRGILQKPEGVASLVRLSDVDCDRRSMTPSPSGGGVDQSSAETEITQNPQRRLRPFCDSIAVATVRQLNALERADVILMYFSPRSQSPITLIELGLHAKSGKVYLACPEGYWRKGNIDITADRYHVPRFETLDALLVAVKARLVELRKPR
jgi:Nucleoside 2-deoxyribosyltransferase like